VKDGAIVDEAAVVVVEEVAVCEVSGLGDAEASVGACVVEEEVLDSDSEVNGVVLLVVVVILLPFFFVMILDRSDELSMTSSVVSVVSPLCLVPFTVA
jgi:hypothetical protein